MDDQEELKRKVKAAPNWLPYALVRDLHKQFMHGELSQGGMAAQLGIGRVDLIHLLEALDLQVTNL